MSDDAALLLRVGAFGLIAGTVYWFVSYEPLGTVALLLLGVGPGFAGLVIMRHRRAEGQGDGSLRELLRRFAGSPPGDPAGPKSLESQDVAVLPGASIWPFTASLGVAVALSGLIFGLWLVILGLGMALYSGWGWIAAVVRETRYGHVEPADQAEDETQAPARR
jgi:hypothetical protein